MLSVKGVYAFDKNAIGLYPFSHPGMFGENAPLRSWVLASRRPLAERFCDALPAGWVLVRRSEWHPNAVNGEIDKTDVLFNRAYRHPPARFHYVALSARGAAHRHFTGDDIQRGIHALRLTFYQPFSDGGRPRQNRRAHGGGD